MSKIAGNSTAFADKDWLLDNGFYRFRAASRSANPPRTGPADYTIDPQGVAQKPR